MASVGDVYENRVTGERAVVRGVVEEAGGGRAVVDLHVRPHGAVAGEHVHDYIGESFEVLSGTIGFRLDGREEEVAGPARRVEIAAGVVHDWWNAGEEEAHVRVEVHPAERFELMIATLYGLANDGRTNAKGMPNFLQLAVIAREFDREIRFVRPPRLVQRMVFGPLALLGRALGYQGVRPYSPPAGATGAAA